MKGHVYGFWGWWVILVAAITTRVQAQNCAPTLSVLQGFLTVSEINGTIGSRIVIRCDVDPLPPTTPVDTYVWQRDGVDLTLGLTENAFDPLQASDGGRYRCGVVLDTTSCSGQTIYSPEVDINTPPEITALTGPTTVTEGQTLELTCDADGWPVPTIQWLHPNGSLVGMETTYNNPSVGQSDGGDYTCQASNSQGMVSQPITITVEVPPPAPSSVIPSPTPAMTSPIPTATPTPESEGPPQVISVTGLTSVEEGGTLELVCTATGSPPPTIQWFHPNGSLVGMEAVYTDTSFGPSDAGNYTCVASNSRGTAMQTVTVTLGDSSNAGLVALVAACASLAAVLTCVTFVMLGFCWWEIQKRDSLKRLRSTSSADELQLIEEAVDDGEEGDEKKGSPQSLTRTPSYINRAFMEDGEDEELTPSPIAEKEDREALYKSDPQQHARRSTSSSSKDKGKADSKGKEKPSAKKKQIKPGQRPEQRQRASSTGAHGVPVFDPRLSRQQQQQMVFLQQQQMRALQQQQRVQQQHSRASVPPEVLLAYERERRAAKPGAKGAQGKKRSSYPIRTETAAAPGEKKGSKQRDARERVSAQASAAPPQEKKGSKRKAASEKTPAPVPVASTGAAKKQKGKKTKSKETERPISPRSQPEGAEDGRQTKKATPEEVQMKEVEAVAQHLPIAEARASEPTVTTFTTGEQDRHDDGDREEEAGAIPTASIVISERTGETVIAMEQEVPDLTELSGGEDEGLAPSGSEEEEKEEGEGASGGKEEDEQRLLPAKGKDKKDSDITRMSVFIEKAKKMGRPVSVLQQLDRSHPLNLAQVQELLENEASHEHTLTIEYNSVPHNAIQSLEQSPIEKQKNRYRNVLPNPHSNVKLHSTGEDGSTYINANFIRGYSGQENAYIAAQGPLVSTIADFWRMVWEQNISIIVMITGLVERSKHKCSKYWPEADCPEPAAYGEMMVRNNFEEKSAAYKVSYLSVYPKDQDDDAVEERDVFHFWYTAWPDFGVPSEGASSLQLREAVNSFQHPDSGPILVHCSAGLGRTGTFMAIDMGIQQYEQEGVVDPLKYMCEMRQDRGGIVQTAEQYVFIHRALSDYMATKPK